MDLGPLVGRQLESHLLQDRWELAQGGRPQFVILSGQRRVGKTFLLNHFANGRRNVWHTANTNAEPVELARFAMSIAAGLGSAVLDQFAGTPTRWDGALRLLAAHGADTPLLVVIDEFTTLLSGTPSFAEQLRDIWDSVAMQRNHHLMLVLTGSSVTAVQRQLAGDAPLFGRATAHLTLQPITLRGALDFLPDLRRPVDLIEAYAACGGFPRNLQAWDASSDTNTNLMALAGSPGGALLTEAREILYDYEGRGPGYGRVLRALGHERLGHARLHERAAIKDAQHVVTVLEDAGVIRREVPVGESLRSTKRRVYRILNPYLRFWFSVLGDEVDAVEGGRGQVVLERARTRWDQHVAAVFEDACRAHALRLADQGRWGGPEVGRWWGTPRDPDTRQAEQTEVDVLGLVGAEIRLVGEVKWGSVRDEDLARLEILCRRLPLTELANKAIWSTRPRRARSGGAEWFTVDDVIS